MLGDSLEDASEEELIALAIAASLSEASAPAQPAFGHGDFVDLPRHGLESDGGAGCNPLGAEGPLPDATSPSSRRPQVGAWGRGAPRLKAAPPQDGTQVDSPSARIAGAEENAGAAATNAEAVHYAEFIGTGHDACANEDEAILGVPLAEIAAQRVVRFRVPLPGGSLQAHDSVGASPPIAPADIPAADSHRGVCETGASAARHRAGGGGDGAAEDEQQPAGIGSAAAVGGEHVAMAAAVERDGDLRWVVHGYEAMALARWLLRDERLPLTSHRVHAGDVERVWDVFVAAANARELDELAAAGELSRDPESGL